ncbi:MAG: MJ0042-type zinc finger domain-containing protein [Actinomycetota bacterium]
MTSPAEKVTVRCPRCGHVFDDWYRPSMNLDLDPWADERYLHDCVHATCPACKTEFRIGTLLVVESGRWEDK